MSRSVLGWITANWPWDKKPGLKGFISPRNGSEAVLRRTPQGAHPSALVLGVSTQHASVYLAAGNKLWGNPISFLHRGPPWPAWPPSTILSAAASVKPPALTWEGTLIALVLATVSASSPVTLSQWWPKGRCKSPCQVVKRGGREASSTEVWNVPCLTLRPHNSKECGVGFWSHFRIWNRIVSPRIGPAWSHMLIIEMMKGPVWHTMKNKRKERGRRTWS